MTSGITYFPQVVPQNSVVGRLSSTAGITEAIPFAQLAVALGVGGSTYLLAGNISGTNTITGTTATAPPLTANQVVFFIAANTNTGVVTFDRDAQGTPKNIFCNGAALVGGEIRAGIPIVMFYDGAQYNLLSQQSIADGQVVLVNAADITKKLKFDLSSLPTGTTTTAGFFSTGDVKLTLKTVADPSWVLMNDTTIGDAASGATGRANADTAALFTLLWNNTIDADCAVSTGRGANAAADYAAHKTIALPKALGRALAGAGAGSGLTARALAHVVGEETHVITSGEMTHTHGAGSYQVTVPGQANSGSGGSIGAPGTFNVFGTSASNNAPTGTGMNVMQPTLFLNVMIKL